MLGGRVKTLHPAVHGGIVFSPGALYDFSHQIGILSRSISSDLKDLEDNGIAPISVVVCNLYPFTETIAKPNCTLPDAVEEIDIGGVTLLRAAAKNHDRVVVLSDPNDYQEFLAAWRTGNGNVGASLRRRLALKAFEMTAAYDEAISGYFRQQYASTNSANDLLSGPTQRLPLRYGANPHQAPAQAFVAGKPLPFKGQAVAEVIVPQLTQ